MVFLWKMGIVKKFPIIQNQFQIEEKQRYKIMLRLLFCMYYPHILLEKKDLIFFSIEGMFLMMFSAF